MNYILDLTDPTVPANLALLGNVYEVALSWDASLDASGVAGYEIWRDAVLLGQTTQTCLRPRG